MEKLRYIPTIKTLDPVKFGNIHDQLLKNGDIILFDIWGEG